MKEQEIEKEEQKKRLIKIGIYILIFIVAIIMVRISGSPTKTINNTETNQETKNEKILENIKTINDNFYKSEVQLTMDDDAITLNYEHINDLEMGLKKYHGETTEYIKYNNTYYKFDNGNFPKLENFIDFNYDKTFINIKNIKKIIELESISSYQYKSDNLNVLKKTYNTKDLLKIYNEHNSTEIIKLDNKEITLEITYTENEIEKITLNLTEFYNILNDKEYEKIIYEMTFENIKEEDTSWLTEKLN